MCHKFLCLSLVPPAVARASCPRRSSLFPRRSFLVRLLMGRLRRSLLVRRLSSTRLHFRCFHRSLLHLRRLLLQLGSLELLPIECDLDDPHCSVVLPVSAQLLVLFLALVMEDQDLLFAALLHDFAGDLRAILGHADLAGLGRDCQHVAEFNLAVGAGALALHSNHIAGRHPVLLPTGADDRVHTYASVNNVSSHPGARRGICWISLLAAFRVGASSEPSGRPQNGAASTGKLNYSSLLRRQGSNAPTDLDSFRRTRPV